MGIYPLTAEPTLFPDPDWAEPNGLVAVGGDLSVTRLLSAYSKGIFPWYDEASPILWWAPDPRCIMEPQWLHVPRSLRRVLSSGRFEVTLDAQFAAVMAACGHAKRPQGVGTWITPEMLEAYTALHQAGFAHSVEVLQDGVLVGGLYGVALGRVFFGESMFHLVPNASKVGFVSLARLLGQWGFELIDCQQTTHNLLRFGAREVSRQEFNQRLALACLDVSGPPGAWSDPTGAGRTAP